MKNFYQYLAESKREYKYRIKLLAPVTDEVMDRIEHTLRKYDVLELASPIKTMIQNNPMDFADAGVVEVWIVDAVTGLPANPYAMGQDLIAALNLPEKYLVVRGENEPKELQTAEYNELMDIAAQAKELGLVPASLLGGPEEAVNNDEMAFGDEYNQRLLDYLAQIQANRPTLVAEPTAPGLSLFKWLEGPEAVADDFNKDIDTPKAVPARDKKPGDEPVKPTALTNHDTMDANRPVARSYRDASGNRTLLKAKK